MLLNCGVGEDSWESLGLQGSNQSILKEISPEYSLEGLMLKLKLQYFGYLMQRTDSLEKTLMLGKIEGWRRRGWQRMRWLDSITDSMDMNLSKFWDIVEGREAWHAAVHRVAKRWTWQLNEKNNRTDRWMERRTDRYRWTIASLVVQKARNPPAVQETQVPSLSREDPLEKGMATYSRYYISLRFGHD